MANVQIAIIDQENTQIALAAPSEAQVNIAVPGIQGPVGQGVPNGGAANQVLFKQSGTDYDTAWSEITSDMIGDLEIVDADVSASAAIAGTKISPDFGSQAVVTTGTSTAASFIPTGSTVPTNGIYSPSANQLAISTNSTGRLFVDANGRVGIGTSTQQYTVHAEAANPRIVAVTSSSTGYSSVESRTSGGSSVVLLMRGATATGTTLGQSNANGAQLYSVSADYFGIGTFQSNPLIFGTNNAERLRITSAGQIQANGLGSATSPILSFTTDTNTGIYSPGADQLAISTNGTGRLFVEADGRIVSEIAGTVDTNRFSTSNRIAYFRTSLAAGNQFGQIAIKGFHGAGINFLRNVPGTGVEANSAGIFSNLSDDLLFTSGGATERLRLTSDGKLGLGTSSPDALLTVNGVGAHGLGSAAAPSFAFTGDLNTGIYSPGADQLAISTNGTGRLFVEADGNVGIGNGVSAIGGNYGSLSIRGKTNDFGGGIIFESLDGTDRTFAYGDVGAFYLITQDTRPLILGTNGTEKLRLTSDGKLGLGTGSPDELLHIEGDTAEFKGTNTNQISNTSGTEQVFKFGIEGQRNSVYGPAGSIIFRQDAATWSTLDANNKPTRIEFCTQSSGSSDDSETPRLVINKDGNVGIGTTAPASVLSIKGSSGFTYLDGSDNTRFGITRETSPSIQHRIFSINYFLNLESTGTSQGAILFTTGTSSGSERARIDSSGRLLVGTSTARSVLGLTPSFQVESTGGYVGPVFSSNANDSSGSYIFFAKSRGAALNSNTIVSSGDQLGTIAFCGADGSTQVEGARIAAVVDGTPGANDLPSRLVFSTTADGASSPTERMRINNAGGLKVSNNGTYPTSLARHEIRNTTNDLDALFINHTGTSGNQYGLQIQTANDQNDTTRYFITCYGGATTQRATIRSNGGFANYSANNVNLSDRNAKKDITPAAGTWDCLKEWEIVNFRYKDQTDDAELNMGVIAQQVAESCPEVITVFQEATEDQPEKLGVKDQQMMWMAIKALQEAQLRIETLEAEVAALKAQ